MPSAAPQLPGVPALRRRTTATRAVFGAYMPFQTITF
jgi:hypothetical protein